MFDFNPEVFNAMLEIIFWVFWLGLSILVAFAIAVWVLRNDETSTFDNFSRELNNDKT